ncbi:MAG: response regulator [Terriglobia bacterium]|jgi:PAS domain S-box-containing protein
MSTKQPVNILMVDDQPGKLLSYETILAGLGENLIRANSGNEALEQLLRNDIALVLVDVCMPELDGFELASMIRSHPRFQRTAIILISSVMVEDVHRLKGYDSGAMDYVSVPIVPEILRAKVAIFADLHRKTEALERLNQELERRVAERTAEIENAAELLRVSEQRFRLLVENVQDYAILILDPEGRISNWNAGAERLYGYRAEEVVGQDFSRFFLPEDLESGRPAKLLQVAAKAGHCEDEGWRVRKDGSRVWANAMTTTLHDPQGKLLGFSKIVHDLTDRKRGEEERVLLLKNAQEARRESDEANQLKDEFLAVLSHELRTPLNAITGWAHMLQAGGLDPETQIKAVETINRNALLQARLISDLLDISRIINGKLHLDLKPVDLPAVVRAAVDTLRVSTEAKEIQVNVALACEPGLIRGDAFRLQQVVWNLLSNAAKFAPRKGNIRISLEKVNSHVELMVQDDGPGIRPDFLPHIFEPFRQEDTSNTRNQRGLGLGLAIVRNLMQLHGGTVQARNREDCPGALFKVTLPLDVSVPEALGHDRHFEQNQPEHQDWLRAGASLKGTRVLVVDDEADAREVVSLVLERCGAKVYVAGSAGEAFELLRRELPEVLVADIEMPGEDGYSLVHRVRMLPAERGGGITAIALTAHAGAHDLAKVLSAGFQGHVPKPLQPYELITAIATLTKSNAENVKETAPQNVTARVQSSGRGSLDANDNSHSAQADRMSRG